MVVVADIVELLKRWDRWRRIDETPERLDALEKRIAELESRLQRAPGLACPSCGELEFRVVESRVSPGPFADLGAREHVRLRHSYQPFPFGKGNRPFGGVTNTPLACFAAL